MPARLIARDQAGTLRSGLAHAPRRMFASATIRLTPLLATIAASFVTTLVFGLGAN